jgi:hypothetical protein
VISSGTNSQPQSHPSAYNITIQTNINTPVQITLRGTDMTPLDVVKFSLVSLPEHGTITYPYGTPPNMVTFTPNSGVTDTDSFTSYPFLTNLPRSC